MSCSHEEIIVIKIEIGVFVPVDVLHLSNLLRTGLKKQYHGLIPRAQ